MSHEEQEFVSNYLTRSQIADKQDNRNELLRIAQGLTPLADDSGRDLTLAGAFAAWLDEATDEIDRTARMRAIRRADNSLYGTGRYDLTPEEFVKLAEKYYNFITG